MNKHKLRIFALIAIFIMLAGFMCRKAARYLVVDNAVESDGIIVLATRASDECYWNGLKLLRKGYGRVLLVNARSDWTQFGATDAAWEKQFVESTAGPDLSVVAVCPVKGDSTERQAASVESCLRTRVLRKVLLVTSDYESRRALAIFKKQLPDYTWSVAPVRNEAHFGTDWWRRSQWAMITLREWGKLLWWQLIERWC